MYKNKEILGLFENDYISHKVSTNWRVAANAPPIAVTSKIKNPILTLIQSIQLFFIFMYVICLYVDSLGNELLQIHNILKKLM